MTSLFAAVLTASLIGSPHCAGMCGPLALLASTGSPNRHHWRQLLATYHVMRLLGYVILGFLAGSIGAALDLGGTLLGLQRIASILAGVGMVCVGTFALYQFWRGQSLHFSLPSVLQNPLKRAHQRLQRLSPFSRAAGIGFLTVLLPCGWLYAFVITATGTAHPWLGAAVMATFWLGTLPALTVVVLGVRQIFGRWRTHLPIATALLLIGTGAALVASRAWVDYGVLDTAVAASTTDQLIDRVANLPDEEMPCCHAD